MRKTYEYGTTGSAVLDAPENESVRPGKPRRPASDPLQPPREHPGNYANDEDTEAFLRASGRARRIRRGIIPQTRTGRIAAGITLVAALAALALAATAATQFLTTSDTFRIPTSAAIEIEGNQHLDRSQMLSVFGEDVERNLFKVPLDERRAQLDAIPWVEHATVMRLLPNRIRVHVTERTPIAFVRQGGTIGMVDAAGVLLDIPPDAPGNPTYSFPVVTGLKASDTVAGRANRMKLYAAFLKDIDSDGKATSKLLSEIDLSDPEDVKALVPDGNNVVLVHFGTADFLARYTRFEHHIPEWRQQYPHLSSVDMRYERQVVLQMPPKDSTVTNAAQTAFTPLSTEPAPAAPRFATAAKPAPRPAAATAAPKTTASAAPHRATAKLPAKPAGKSNNQADMQKRVAAIRAWMDRRQKLRDAQSSKQ